MLGLSFFFILPYLASGCHLMALGNSEEDIIAGPGVTCVSFFDVNRQAYPFREVQECVTGEGGGSLNLMVGSRSRSCQDRFTIVGWPLYRPNEAGVFFPDDNCREFALDGSLDFVVTTTRLSCDDFGTKVILTGKSRSGQPAASLEFSGVRAILCGTVPEGTAGKICRERNLFRRAFNLLPLGRIPDSCEPFDETRRRQEILLRYLPRVPITKEVGGKMFEFIFEQAPAVQQFFPGRENLPLDQVAANPMFQLTGQQIVLVFNVLVDLMNKPGTFDSAADDLIIYKHNNTNLNVELYQAFWDVKNGFLERDYGLPQRVLEAFQFMEANFQKRVMKFFEENSSPGKMIA